jgi:hypothetical protein
LSKRPLETVGAFSGSSMSNFGILRETILGCVSRAKSSFQAGSQNFVDLAINNAVIYAQRNWDFQFLKGDVKIVCNPRGSMMTAVDECNCTVKLKRIIKAYGAGVPDPHTAMSIPYLSRQSQIADVTNANANACTCYSGAKVVHDGESVYLSPATVEAGTPYDLWFHAVRWLPRLTRDEHSNFLFEYGFDFLMYRSIYELNFFIKEDERFSVSTKMLNDAWASLTAWDVSLVSPTETEIEL